MTLDELEEEFISIEVDDIKYFQQKNDNIKYLLKNQYIKKANSLLNSE